MLWYDLTNENLCKCVLWYEICYIVRSLTILNNSNLCITESVFAIVKYVCQDAPRMLYWVKVR